MAKNRALSLFDRGGSKLPAAPLQRRGKMSEGIESRNYARIGLKGQRFRPTVNGVTGKAYAEEELPVLIVDWAPALQRLYFEGVYDPSEENRERPACFSDDGKKPHPAAVDKQSATCASCPMNAVGSGQNGQGRACSMMRRLLVKVIGDHSRLYTIDLKAKSIFKSDQEDGYFNYQKYAQVLDEHGVDAMQVITGMSFDERESVPVLRFRPVDYPTEEEVEVAVQLYEDLGKEEAARVLSLHIEGGNVTEEADGSREPTRPELIPGKSRAAALSRDEDDEPAPRTRARRAELEDDEDEDEKPAPRARARKAEPEDAEVIEEKPAPRTRARRADPEDDDEDEKPAPRARARRADPEDDDEDEKPAPRARARRADPEDDEDEGVAGKKPDEDDAAAVLRAKMLELGVDPDLL